MAKSKYKTVSSLLDELDKPLYEGRWKDIEQTLKKIKKKQIIPEAFSTFVQGVELLECYLVGLDAAYTQGQSTSASAVHPDNLLKEAETKIKKCIDMCQPGHDASLIQLARIKHGQLLWIRGEYRLALDALQEVQSTADISLLHTCKVLVEGYLYQALCFEMTAVGKDRVYQLVQAISAYEASLQHAIALIHQVKLLPSLTSPQHPATLNAIRTIIKRGPLLAMIMNSRARALEMYRAVLHAGNESVLQDARLICAISLASLLIFHSSPSSHTAPSRRPSLTPHSTVYSPTLLEEEAILVTLIAKTVTNTWTVSKIDPVPSPAVIFDLATLAFADAKVKSQLVLVLEESMKFACDMPHIWFQFALALVSNGQNEQALAVFHECISLSPKDPLILTTAANFAVEKVKRPELCVKWATMASEVVGGHFLEPRVEFLLGRGYTVLTTREISSQKRGELHKIGLAHLKKACELDPQNVDYAFHLALQFAESRELVRATTEVQRALSLNSGHTSCLHLLTLILSAQKHYSEALKVCDFALQKQPENFGLLECKTKLEVILVNTHQALKTCKHALQLWQKLFAKEASGLIGIVTQDRHSLSDIPLTTYERSAANDGVSPDIASDTGSSHFSLNRNAPPNQPNLLQARIWCTIAEVFISAGKVPDALSCVREAQYLAPHLSSVLITHGRVLLAEGHTDQALEQYRNAISLQPGNPTALTLIGQLLYYHSEKITEAEKYLQEATSIDQLNHEAWYWLGKVFSAQKHSELSADCLKTALDLEQSAPIQPFSAVLSSFIPSS